MMVKSVHCVQICFRVFKVEIKGTVVDVVIVSG